MFSGLRTNSYLKCGIAVILSAAPAFAQFAPNRFILLLEDPPVVSRFAKREQLQSPQALAYRGQIESRQRAVMSQLAGRNIAVTGSVSTLLNAVFVTASPDRVSEMLAIPGVAGVRPVRWYKANLNRATQLMNAPGAWNKLGGQGSAGKGMKIAIIDSGIDQTHPAFQDSSLTVPAGFPKCTTGHSEDCAFTNNKVIVARSYVRQLAVANVTDKSNPAAQSQPDDYTPRDRLGHGTAVASAAAANPTAGPTVTITGMAPKAFLGNYKIVGSPGVNDSPTDDVMIQAIEDALKDGMDVASLSWGGPSVTGATDTGAACGLAANQPCDPLAAAYEAAAQSGLVIAVAAGNSGSDALLSYNENYPYFNSISSPATAPSVIGVGATTNSHVLTPTVSVNDAAAPSALKGIAAQPGDSFFYPSTQGANTGPLLDVSTLGNDGYACASLPAFSLNGAYALIERGPAANPCTFSAKADNAAAAGAIGVIFYMADGSGPFPPGGLDIVGPSAMISNSDGLALKAYIDANPGKPVTIDLAGQETDLATYNQQQQISPAILSNQLASFSSFGPAPDGAIKPDLVATGGLDATIAFSAGLYVATQSYDVNGAFYSANRYMSVDGTSLAAPIVAGAAALVKQAHPDYSAADVRSALVNSTAQDTKTDDQGYPVDVEWLGAGRLDAGAAVNTTVTVTPSVVSFGYLKSSSLPITKNLTITNRGTDSQNLQITVTPNATASGATVAVNKTSLTVAPGTGSAQQIQVTLSGTVPAAGSYSGVITIKSSNVSLSVPYMFLVPAGVAYNVVPLTGALQGTPGQDAGPIAIQVIDQFGVPVAGVPVSFSASAGSVTMHTVTGEPACSPNNASLTVCNTDNYGIAYTEVVLGTKVSTPTITAKASGNTFSFTAYILAAPAVTPGQVLNNASFQTTVAPGSIIAIKGANLMDTDFLTNTTQGYDLATTSPYPLVLDAVNVSFDVPSAGISVPAAIVAVSKGQINVQVPWELAGQTSAQAKVIVDQGFGNTIYSNVVTTPIADYTPAFFLNSGNVADALDLNYKVVTASNPAVRGQVIQLFANGLGPVNNQPGDGAPAVGTSSTTKQTCTVTIGGQPASVGYCGLAPGFTVYQVNVTVPNNIDPGNQAIKITVGGKSSPDQTSDSPAQAIVVPVK